MARFISFGNPSPKDLEENPLISIWNLLTSLDKFTKTVIVAFFLLIVVTPIITTQYLEYRQHATSQIIDEETDIKPLPNEIILKFKPGIKDENKKKIYDQYGLKLLENIPQLNLGIIDSSNAKNNTIDLLKNDPFIEYAEPNYVGKLQTIPNDGAITNNKQWTFNNMSAQKAWDINIGTNSAIVAVIDSGVNQTHEDLQGKVLPGHNFIDNNNDTNDTIGHGTAIAGIIGAATNNEKGIASLGWNTQILPIKAANEAKHIIYSDAIKAIVFAVENKAKIINLSWGGTNSSFALQDAINYAWGKGIVLIAAAGNNGTGNLLYPGASNNVIAVGATDLNNSKAFFSNSGPELDIMAPGVDVYTTDLNGYSNYSGTSIATAQVSAIVSLISEINPKLTNSQIAEIITSTARNSANWNEDYGFGLIDVSKSLDKAQNETAASGIASISITSPVSEDSLTGFVNVSASVNTNIPVTKVEFSIDDKVFADDETFPFLVSLDSTTVKNGIHTINTKAFAVTGESSFPSSIKVDIKN